MYVYNLHLSFKLSLSTAYLVEYLVRFVARLRPTLSQNDVEDLMRRLVGALTQQSVLIRNETHPAGKKFPKLRGGTEDSTLKFMIKLYHMVGGGAESNSGNDVQGTILVLRKFLTIQTKKYVKNTKYIMIFCFILRNK